MIGISSKTSDKTKKWLERLADGNIFSDLQQYGRMGVDALARATPVDTGVAASSWDYIIIQERSRYGVAWVNYDRIAGPNSTPVVILLQYGHGTGTGGYVYGRDFINPAIKPIFDYIEEAVWKEVTKR